MELKSLVSVILWYIIIIIIIIIIVGNVYSVLLVLFKMELKSIVFMFSDRFM